MGKIALKDEILQLIRKRPGLTDREIRNAVRGTAAEQQPINIACRQLAEDGLVRRDRARPNDNLIGNYPTGTVLPDADRTRLTFASDHSAGELTEDEIKAALDGWLKSFGWKTKIAWGRQAGIDIVAERRSERWIIEVKGPGSRPPMRVNYFLAILGETLQRMSDERATYSIALPDMAQYRRLWDGLPSLAKRRTSISLLLVSKEGAVIHLVN